MLIYHCKYCEEKVSPKAEYCPNCGEPKPAISKKAIWIRLFWKLGLICLAIPLLHWTWQVEFVPLSPWAYMILIFLGCYLWAKCFLWWIK